MKILRPLTQGLAGACATVLAWIAIHGEKRDALRWALAQGANPNGLFNRNERFLHHACQIGWVEGVRELLCAGAQTELKTVREQATPLFIAATLRNEDLIDLLVQHDADLHGTGICNDDDEFFAVLESFDFDPPWGLTIKTCTMPAYALIKRCCFDAFDRWERLDQARSARLLAETLAQQTVPATHSGRVERL